MISVPGAPRISSFPGVTMGPLTPHQEIKTVDHPFWEVELESVPCCTTRAGPAEDAARWSMGEVFEPDIAPGMEQALPATRVRIDRVYSAALGSIAAGATVGKVGRIIAGWVVRSEETLGPDVVRLECGRRRGIALVDATILACSVGTLLNIGPHRRRQT